MNEEIKMYIPEKGSSNRLDKIKKELSRFVAEKLISESFSGGGYRVGSKALEFKPMITITRVDLTPNMRHAVIYFHNFDQNPINDVFVFLNHIAGALSQQWARNARTKYTPSFEFRIDETVKESHRIDALFDKIKANPPADDSTKAD